MKLSNLVRAALIGQMIGAAAALIFLVSGFCTASNLRSVTFGLFHQDPLTEVIFWTAIPALICGWYAWWRRRWAFIGSMLLSVGLLSAFWFNLRDEWGHEGQLPTMFAIILNTIQLGALMFGFFKVNRSGDRV